MANWIKVAIVESILRLRQLGWSFRRIARALAVHRERQHPTALIEFLGQRHLGSSSVSSPWRCCAR